MIDFPLYKQSYDAVGLQVGSCDSSGGRDWLGEPNEPLAQAVFASINKPLDSEECLALQKMLGPESPEWAAYVECRKQPIRDQRQLRYEKETDPLKMKLDAEYEVGKDEHTEALEAWRAARLKIQEELPYPE
jgi:hypothetical protein